MTRLTRLDELLTWDVDDPDTWLLEWDGETVRQLVAMVQTLRESAPTCADCGQAITYHFECPDGEGRVVYAAPRSFVEDWSDPAMSVYDHGVVSDGVW